MVTNLPAEAKAAWVKVMEAKTPEEKLRALQEFLSKVPKHKGTENLVHWVRRRIAQLRKEVELRKTKERMIRGGGGGKRIYIEKEGDVQIVIIGPPMSGKSSLLKCLTNAKIEPDDIPFSNTEPIPGMLICDNIYIQLIKVPSITFDNYDSDLNILTASLIRNADGVLIIMDISNPDVIKQLNKIFEIMKLHGIYLTKPKALIKIERRNIPGIQIIGKIVNASIEDVKKLLIDYGFHGAIVYIDGEATIEDIEDSIFREYVYRPSIIILNKIDLVDSEYVKYVVDCIKSNYPNIPILLTSLSSCKINSTELTYTILKTLDLIRVFTKEPHSSTYSPKPIIVKKGTTVGDLAKMIHSQLYERFKYAKIWKINSFPQNFKRVGIDYQLEDGDIVEIRT